MPAAARLVIIRSLVGREPVGAALTNSDASTSQSRRVTQITFTRRPNRLFGITTAGAAIPTGANSVPGRRQVAARVGRTWKALKEVPYGIARIAPAIIHKTGTTRALL